MLPPLVLNPSLLPAISWVLYSWFVLNIFLSKHSRHNLAKGHPRGPNTLTPRHPSTLDIHPGQTLDIYPGHRHWTYTLDIYPGHISWKYIPWTYILDIYPGLVGWFDTSPVKCLHILRKAGLDCSSLYINSSCSGMFKQSLFNANFIPSVWS